MSLVSQIFGTSAAVVYARCGGSGNNAQGVLAALASGLGAATGDGIYVYNLFNAQTGFTQSGFRISDTYTTALENVVGVILGISGNPLIGTAAIMYSYANFPNISQTGIVGYINKFNNVYAGIVGINSFNINESGLNHCMSSFSLSGINASLSGIPDSPNNQTAINYNWYDSSGLFANPNFNGLAQVIKDSENQYYFLSGECIYPSIPSGLNPCVEFIQTTNTPTGQISFTVIANLPCYSPSSYVGPISGTKFYREFNDGPGSSGYFDSGTEAAYIGFDEAILSYNDYHSNSDVLYSNTRDSNGNFIELISDGQVDSYGFYNPANEYGFGHSNLLVSTSGCPWEPEDFSAQSTTYFTWADYTGSGLPLQNMHQGNNSEKWVLTKYCVATDGDGHCLSCAFTGQLYPWTGWKFAPFQLNETMAKNYEFFQMNPAIDTGRVIKRVFNLNNQTGSSPVSPYAYVADTGDGTLTCTGIVGPPQLSSDYPSLPGFAFFQNFDNITFSDYASITMNACVESGGSYVISNFTILATGLTGVHYPVFGESPLIPFSTKIHSSGMSLYDDITRKCLAIGDNFGGNGVSGIQTPQSNAGYKYTGYTYYQSGILVNVNQLLEGNSNTVGSAYSTINYVSGYTGVDGTVYPLESQYAFIITGDTSTGINYFGQPIIYSYLPDGSLGAINTGWNVFAPQPSEIIFDIANNSPREFTEVYNSQQVENYVPRYSSGPYLSYANSFLYPNASVAFNGFSALANGFPTGIAYTVQFQEETVSEFYCLKNKYGSITYPKVIRALTDSTTGFLKSSMVQPFIPDNQNFAPIYALSNTGLYPQNGSFEYDVGISEQLVDANWVPSINFTSDVTLNSQVYNGNDGISQRWKCGIKVNEGTVKKTMMTGVGKSGIVYQSVPAMKKMTWGYYGKTLTGMMNYSLPIFDLSTESLVVDSGMANTINAQANTSGPCYQTNQAASFDGCSVGNLSGQTYFYGQDPIFYQYIGGRIGSGANEEGGYNSGNIVGDAWYGLNIDTWGLRRAQCADCPTENGYTDHTLHGPENDSHIFFVDLTSSGLNLHTKSLSYYPYYYNNFYQPFLSSINVGISNLVPRWIGAEYYFDFDLEAFFSLTSGTGSLYSNGLNIGPFDRDVELCVESGNVILPSGVLIIDGQALTTNVGVNLDCYDNFSNVALDSGIIPGEGNRSPVISTFKLIPKGSISNINLSGTSGSLIGFSGKSIATIRPRTFDGSTSYLDPHDGTDYTNQFGDGGLANFDRFINNGAEGVITIPYNGFDLNSLNGKTFATQTVSNQTLLYPMPDTDFSTIVPTGLDRYGNTTYPANPTAYYWSVKAPNAFFSGIRDVTRILVTVNSISVSGVGSIPYQSQRIIVPTGDCVISGVFGYTGEAESAVVSDGIALSGITGARALSGLFQPLYVSDVMSRIPAPIFNIPSGSGYMPVLPAPSFMQTRQNPFYITGNDAYVGISPYSGSDYNAFLWPAWSDLALLNPELVYEQMPPDDGNVFMNSYLTFSASQGQAYGVTGINLRENVTYKVIAQYGFVDSTSTNAIYNTGACIFSGSTLQLFLDSGDLSGILTSQGNSLTMALNLGNYKT